MLCTAVWEALYVQLLMVKIVAREACGWQLCAERVEQQSVSYFRKDWLQKLAVCFVLCCESILQEMCHYDSVNDPENGLRDLWCYLKLSGLQR